MEALLAALFLSISYGLGFFFPSCVFAFSSTSPVWGSLESVVYI